MRIVKLTNETKNKLMSDLLKRTTDDYGEQETIVKEIIKNVHDNGDSALFDYTKKFDKADINASNIKVTDAEIEEAYGQVDGDLVDIIRKAIKNIKEFFIFCRAATSAEKTIFILFVGFAVHKTKL